MKSKLLQFICRVLKISALVVLVLFIVFLILGGILSHIEEKEKEQKELTDIKTYTLEEMNQISGGTLSIGKNFYNEFPEYSKVYNLSSRDQMIVGEWGIFQVEGPNPFYIFYPNRLFLGSSGKYMYKMRKGDYLGDEIGTWQVENNKLMVTIYGYLEGTGDETYIKYVKPFDCELIDMKYIAGEGYTKVPFKIIPLANEVEKKVEEIKSNPKGYRSFRYIWNLHPIGVKLAYGYLSYIPYIAEHNISAMGIIQNTDVCKEIFHDRNEVVFSDYPFLHANDPYRFPGETRGKLTK